MAAPSPSALLERIEALSLGMHGGIPSTMLTPQHVAMAVNVTFRGGTAVTRPHLRKIALTHTGETATTATAALFQGASAYSSFSNVPDCLVASIGGRIFRYNIGLASAVVSDISPPGPTNDPTAPQAWLGQGEDFLIINDGLGLPIFFDGASTRRSLGPAGRELPPGCMGTYNNGRWVQVLPDRRSYIAGDLVYSPTSGTPAYNYRDSILKINENIAVLGGRAFAVPINAGRITAMFSVAVPDTSLGQGPLQVGTRKGVFGVHLPLDSTLWTTLQQPTSVVSLPSAGPTSHYSVAIVNTDAWYRSKLGIRSFQVGRRDMNTWVQTALSSEVGKPILDYDSSSLLSHASAVTFNNRLLMTCSPYRVAGRGIAHRGLIALDFNNISALTTRSQPDYDGLWTGLQVLQVLVGELNGADRCFLFALDGANEICLYELLLDDAAFADHNGTSDVAVESWYASSALYGLDQFTPERVKLPLKQLHCADIFLEQLSGPVTVNVKYHSDAYPFWVDWKEFSLCASMCVAPEDCAQPATYQQQYATFKRLPDPADTCNPATGRKFRTGYYFQLRVQWTGHAAIDRVLVWADPLPETIPGCPTTEECKVLTGCTDDLFTYDIEPCSLGIATQPASQTLSEGGNLSLTVASSGGVSPVTVQWYKDGLPLVNGGNVSGVTTTTLSVTTVTTADAGAYYATFTDSSSPACTATSATALVTVGTTGGIIWTEDHEPPTPPTCDSPNTIHTIQSAYAWGLATDQNPNELLDADQIANALALFASERTAYLDALGGTATAVGSLYWAYYPGTATALSGLHKAASGSTDPSDPTGNVSVLFNGYYHLAQAVCVAT